MFALALLGLMAAELVSDGDPRKLSVVFILLAWYPLLAVHELGHALVARALGWRVHEIVLGFGPEVARLRLAGAQLRLRLIPAGGYVVPSPTAEAGARWQSALIYFAGPGTELLLAGALVLGLGSDLALPGGAAGDGSLLVLAVQSLVVAAVMGAVMNLLPTSAAGGASDGLGILVSLFGPPNQFRYRIVHPTLRRAQKAIRRGDGKGALSLIDEALAERPDDPFLLAMRARCLNATGAPEEALSLLSELRETPEWSDMAEAERLHAAAEVALDSGDTGMQRDGERACRAALERAPGDPELLCLQGRLLLSLQRPSEAAAVLQQAYNHARDSDLEPIILRHMADAAETLGDRDEASHLRAAANAHPSAKGGWP